LPGVLTHIEGERRLEAVEAGVLEVEGVEEHDGSRWPAKVRIQLPFELRRQVALGLGTSFERSARPRSIADR
jgi:hypothetical protein